MKFVFDHEALLFSKEDFQKRKRVKNVVPHLNVALPSVLLANSVRGEKGRFLLLWTHAKGTPHGVSEGGDVESSKVNKIEVWVEEINGINYYIDANQNVYRAEDIVENKFEPAIIAKWKLDDNGVYTIPAFTM